jgi:hypothetical protein
MKEWARGERGNAPVLKNLFEIRRFRSHNCCSHLDSEF